jgi:hypothetical protein
LALVERDLSEGRAIYTVRRLQRWPVRTSYPDVVADVRQLVGWPDFAGRLILVVDGTGVGRGIVDQFTAANLPVPLIAVSIVAGESTSREGFWHRVPKRDLVGDLMTCLQERRLRVPSALPEAKVLADELRAMRQRVTTAGNTVYGATGRDHDDLAIATALGLWAARRRVGIPRKAVTRSSYEFRLQPTLPGSVNVVDRKKQWWARDARGGVDPFAARRAREQQAARDGQVA